MIAYGLWILVQEGLARGVLLKQEGKARPDHIRHSVEVKRQEDIDVHQTGPYKAGDDGPKMRRAGDETIGDAADDRRVGLGDIGAKGAPHKLFAKKAYHRENYDKSVAQDLECGLELEIELEFVGVANSFAWKGSTMANVKIAPSTKPGVISASLPGPSITITFRHMLTGLWLDLGGSDREPQLQCRWLCRQTSQREHTG